MIYKDSTFEPWHGAHEYRQCLTSFDRAHWLSPDEAEEILIAHGALTPLPNHREFLVWKAEMGSLATIAGEVYQSSGDDTTIYTNVPLTTEWSLPEWKSPHASLWLNGTMRMTRSYVGEKQSRDFLEIAFERDEIGILAQLYASVDPSFVQKDGSKIWPEDQMTKAIRDCGHNNRERAWKNYFKPIQHIHGWKLQAWRDHWPLARGTKGQPGAPKMRG